MTTTSAPPSSRTAKKPTIVLSALGIAAALLLTIIGASLAGRRDEQLPKTYGKRRGTDSLRSVNGTAVLAELFKKAGHRVTTLGRLSPRLDDFDIVVWIPDDFEPPKKEQRDFLEDWLARGDDKESSRTVVYVGRDYDAAVAYWDRMAPQVPADQADEALRRKAEARAAHEADRSKMPPGQATTSYARWFSAQRDQPPKKSHQLRGPWAKDIDAAKTEIHLEGRMAVPRKEQATSSEPFPADFEVLLSSGDDPLVTRVTNDVSDGWGDGQILVVANGSLVLNYPLVNHEHRKLAARLVAECGPPGRVVFVESGPGGPPVLEKEPSSGAQTPLELLKVWPLNAILLHLTILGIVFCLARSPIFGRPRELRPESPADFGKHVAALGQLLARTKDRHYAQSRLSHYRQIAERKSGRSHTKHQ
jgi:hypothetical protein